jgi:hypothetical protein
VSQASFANVYAGFLHFQGVIQGLFSDALKGGFWPVFMRVVTLMTL